MQQEIELPRLRWVKLILSHLQEPAIQETQSKQKKNEMPRMFTRDD